MTLLSAILCRAFGHKPYESARWIWEKRAPGVYAAPVDGALMMITRCKRCGDELGPTDDG